MQGQTYNIPISLTLLDTHPYHAPMAFVKPTAYMQIRVSKYVDASGKIYLPYLDEWAHPNYDLLGLVQMCVIIFSEQPPVFAKPRNQPQVGLPYPVNGSLGGGNPPQQQGPVFPLAVQERDLIQSRKAIENVNKEKDEAALPTHLKEAHASPGGGEEAEVSISRLQAKHAIIAAEGFSKLIDFLTKSVEEKAAALKCPVCLETVKAPIFMCQQQHLVCSSCQPKLSSCPECREPYQGQPRRHRWAERNAEELENMLKELANLPK